MSRAGTGRTGVAILGAAGGALVFHLLTSLANISEGLGVIAWLSPFHYYPGSDPLINGMDWGDSAVLAALPIVLFGLSFVLFQRRRYQAAGIRLPVMRCCPRRHLLLMPARAISQKAACRRIRSTMPESATTSSLCA